MNLQFDISKSQNYSSNSQIARVLTENWVKENSYCPNCGHTHLSEFENNKPVADFFCNNCSEEYELKSKDGNKLGDKIVDGAYSTMIERINSANNPNFFFLNYRKSNWVVNNFLIIPKYYFIPDIIIKRKPLSITAKRAGWIGCNIDISKVPERGRIFLIKDSEVIDRNKVYTKWKSTDFLQSKHRDTKVWILDVMNCIESLQNNVFTLEQIYSFEDQLRLKYPNNNHIKDKIRQQLQLLRDKGLLEFVERGKYKKIIL
jgi:type II restriction enzyme